MPPPAEPNFNSGDWPAVEAKLGTKLPDDYKAFIDNYGSGMIGNVVRGSAYGMTLIHILNDFDPAYSLSPMVDAVRESYEQVASGGTFPVPYPLHPDRDGLLVWAVTANGDYIHWLTKGHPN
jgi:hypothetical protein